MPASTAAKPLRLERSFDATPAQLWAAWMDPAQYAQWFNPAGIPLVIHEFDPRPGGRVRFDMPQPDGNPNPQDGVFHELTPYREIVSGSPDRSFLVRVTFQPKDATTLVTIEVTGMPPEHHEMATVGWNMLLDRLVALLGRHKERPGSQTLHFERVFDCSIDRMWAAWTDPTQYAKWISPFPGTDAEVHEFDPRVGGRVRFTMVDDKGNRFPEELGFFEVIDPPREIVMLQLNDQRKDVFADHPMRMHARFEATGGKTRLRFDVTGLPASFPLEMARGGFGSCLDKLAAVAERPAAPGFTVERVFAATPEKVWEMWTTKAGLAAWWGAGVGMEATVTELDVRPGGRYAIRMKNAEVDAVNHGRYVAVVPHRHLGMVWRFDIFLPPDASAYDVPITVDLEPVPGGTRLVFKQGPLASEEFTRGSEAGVRANLESLAKLVEAK